MAAAAESPRHELKPTLKDIAAVAGVSAATVSMVLNGKGNISQDVREKIHRIAQELGYIKPAYGAAIATNRSSHIAVLLHEDYERAFLWNFTREMFVQLEATITQEQYYPVIIPVTHQQSPHDILQKVVLSRATGLVSIHYGNTELFEHLEAQDIPVVVLNNSGHQNRFYAVCVDDFQGAYDGTVHLLSLGHKRLAYIEYEKPDNSACVNDRFIGFKKAIDECQVDFVEEDRIKVKLHDVEQLYQKLQPLFQRELPPTALFVHDDYQAAQVVMLLQRLGLNIPDDVSILAPGDTLDFNLLFTPQISTMRINTALLGKLAGEMMLKRLRHEEEETHVLKVTQKLFERGSCKKIGKGCYQLPSS